MLSLKKPRTRKMSRTVKFVSVLAFLAIWVPSGTANVASADVVIKVDDSFKPTGKRGGFSTTYPGDLTKNWVYSYDSYYFDEEGLQGSLLSASRCTSWSGQADEFSCTKSNNDSLADCNSYSGTECWLEKAKVSVGDSSHFSSKDMNPSGPNYFVQGVTYLSMCSDAPDVGCIESVEASQGDSGWIKLEPKYQLGKYSMSGNSQLGIPKSAGASILKFPESSGSPFEIKLLAGGNAYVEKGKFHFKRFSLSADAVVERTGNYESKIWPTTTPWSEYYPGYQNTVLNCRPFAFSIKGVCGISYVMPSDLKLKVSIRVASPMSGWLTGRLNEPVIESSSENGLHRIVVQGGPQEVPQIYASVDPAKAKNSEIGSVCLYGCMLANEGNLDTATFTRKVSRLDVLDYLAKPSLNDTASFLDRTWRLTWQNTDTWDFMAKLCNEPNSGLQAVLTTNSTFYDDHPPTFDPARGDLVYSVGGLHNRPDGTIFEGSYDLALKKSVALCLFGLKNVPLKATVSIKSVDGEAKTAVSVLQEKNGWVYFRVRGFTFSSNNIKVSLAAKKAYTVTCYKTSKPKLTKKVTSTRPTCPTGYKQK